MADSPQHPIPAAPPIDSGPDDPVYKPLSVVAIAGFALACLYGIFLFICAFVAIYRGTPLLMSSFTLLLPAAALLLSFLGYLEVQRSEGTRAGAALAVWGMTASALLGLAYVAYTAGSYLAVRQAADREIRQYLTHLLHGETDLAFRLSLQPSERPPADDTLHSELEQRKNLEAADPTLRGLLTIFEQNTLTRRLGEAGANAALRTGGVRAWEYSDAGYKVTINYQVVSPEGSLDFFVTAHGREPTRGQGRQWTIVQSESGVASFAQVARGQHLDAVRKASSEFLNEWWEHLAEGRTEEAFLATLEPDQREKVRAAFHAHLAGMALAPKPVPIPPDAEAQRLLLLPGYQDFRKGSLVSLASNFWAPATVKTEVLPEIQRLFGPSADPNVLQQSNEMNSLPAVTLEGDRLRFRHAFLVRHSRFLAELDIVTETAATVAEPGSVPPTFRIQAVEIKRARSNSGGPSRSGR